MSRFERVCNIGLTITFVPTGGIAAANIFRAADMGNGTMGIVNIGAALAAVALLAIDEMRVKL